MQEGALGWQLISLSFDFSQFEKRAREIGGAIDQVPYALSNALNDAAFKARQSIITETWPQHVQVRDRNFLRNALRVEKATKRGLRVAVTTEGSEAGQRAHLPLHESGGAKPARKNLAIPDSKNVQPRRTGRGVPKNLRPAALANSFRKGDVIFQRVGRKGKQLKQMYVLRPSARIKPAVPFHRDFNRVMTAEVARAFPKAMAKAMASRR